jgi:membrane protease YdiL (CAAX protease family)
MTRLTTLGVAVPTVVLASAVLQAAYHTYQGLAFALVYLPLFVVFAAYFAWRRNAVAPALAHVMVDVVSWTALHSGFTGR